MDWIRKAVSGEAQSVLDFYDRLIDTMRDSPYPLRWEKGVYPTLPDIEEALEEGCLYLAEDAGKIAGAFIVNHTQGTGYDSAAWVWQGDVSRVAVLHLLATDSALQGNGIGRQLLRHAAEVCRARGDGAIRLDTLPWNIPGKRLYEGFGFQYRGDVELTYPSTGTIAFSMYEYIL